VYFSCFWSAAPQKIMRTNGVFPRFCSPGLRRGCCPKYINYHQLATSFTDVARFRASRDFSCFWSAAPQKIMRTNGVFLRFCSQGLRRGPTHKWFYRAPEGPNDASGAYVSPKGFGRAHDWVQKCSVGPLSDTIVFSGAATVLQRCCYCVG
jgi:hypothetical protein